MDERELLDAVSKAYIRLESEKEDVFFVRNGNVLFGKMGGDDLLLGAFRSRLIEARPDGAALLAENLNKAVASARQERIARAEASLYECQKKLKDFYAQS